MARKRRKAPKILLHPMFLWLRGKMGNIASPITAKYQHIQLPIHLHWHAGASVSDI